MGATVLDVEGVKALASLPSLDELRAKIVGLLVAPATKLATITQAPAAQLARVLMPMRRRKPPEAASDDFRSELRGHLPHMEKQHGRPERAG